jgi:hypothetical protein
MSERIELLTKLLTLAETQTKLIADGDAAGFDASGVAWARLAAEYDALPQDDGASDAELRGLTERLKERNDANRTLAETQMSDLSGAIRKSNLNRKSVLGYSMKGALTPPDAEYLDVKR